MAVGGDNSAPIIGLVTLDKPAVDLVECPLTPEPVRQLLRAVRELIRSQKLSPYDIATRVGELKHVIVMTSADHSQAIVRFVLRSSEALPRIRKSVNHLQTLFPWVKVISCNIQPKPAAILEGPEEIILTAEQVISEHFGEIALFLAPQSFMQVTPEVARALYAQAAHYIKLEQPQLVLDLFCGVGGFSLHAARHATHVTGVELSSAATECAQRGAKHLHLSNTQFHAADVESFLNTYDNAYPDVVIVNPPRRGLSSRILSQLLRLQPRMILYSSCAPETFARDAQLLNPSYILEELTPFDMFPMTLHCELLGRFIRAS
jgi:23S rRNA (uracil747-C5)-methyltransferase